MAEGGRVAIVSGGDLGIGRETALARILAIEERGNGLLVNCACPGWVRTDMGERTPLRGDWGFATIRE